MGGQREHVRLPQELLDVLAEAEELHVLSEAGALRLFLECALQRALAGQPQVDAPPALHDVAQRVEEHRVVLHLDHSADREE